LPLPEEASGDTSFSSTFSTSLKEQEFVKDDGFFFVEGIKNNGSLENAFSSSDDFFILLRLRFFVDAWQINTATSLAHKVANGGKQDDEGNNCNSNNVGSEKDNIRNLYKLFVSETLCEIQSMTAMLRVAADERTWVTAFHRKFRAWTKNIRGMRKA
jgi:hypothetical protein